MNIQWKGASQSSVIPTNSRPFYNGDANLANIERVPFKPNPIKHWRKQLKPYYPTNSKQVSINSVNAPSTNTIITSNNGIPACSTNNYQLLKENISLLNDCYGSRVTDNDNQTKCVGGSNHITRSANTNIKKTYHVSHSKYLQAKCKTYDRNQQIGKQTSEPYTFESGNCQAIYNQGQCSKKVIYKPNNPTFGTQGSVMASATILKRRNEALTNNSASLKTAYGSAPVFIRDYKPGTTGYETNYVKGNLIDNSAACHQAMRSCK